ncbi:hypothetical protein LTR62_005437 [Meristemomyces frigidus]|uniref:Amidohydrolase-related domain-containing protein n=1 Tax=Meristemomyces frigidus TaxID=1508187 RepID=A0AAN7YNH0_9PEZI|nr:hypothetical protein LTR62_005437 [Meristemomyces frigidus]
MAVSQDRRVRPFVGVWDTHLHILDPQNFPYAENRTYTPAPALWEDLLNQSVAAHFLVVQASVENGHSGLLTQLARLGWQYPGHIFRAEVVYEEISPQQSDQWSSDHLEALHQAGVRCLRLRNPKSASIDDIVSEVGTLLHGRLGQIARQKGWAIAMQLPLQAWAGLTPTIEHILRSNTKVIAEHIAGITFPLSPASVSALDIFANVLRRHKNLYVKLGALHRRVHRSSDDAADQLRDCVREIADAAGPANLLWGSDWPHVDSRPGQWGVENPHLLVDEAKELEVLWDWLEEEQMEAMLVGNPMKLFGW